MEHLTKIQFDISSDNPGAALEVEVWIDQNKILDAQIVESRHVEYRLDDNIDGDHELRFVLKNKTDKDTVVDENGKIVKDSLIKIENLFFDDIDISEAFIQLSEYRHNNNGHSDVVVERLLGGMGCNGTVTLKFTTPIYLWLLENL